MSQTSPLHPTLLVAAGASGVKWTGAAAAVNAGGAILQILVLARLLAPSDFGLMAAAMVVLGFAQAFADGGVSQALLRSKSDTPEIRSSLYWLNIAVSVCAFVVVMASSSFVENFYGAKGVAEVLRWASVVFLLVPWGLQFQILLQKNLRFRTLAIVQVAATIAGTAVAIASAALQAGALALVWGWVTTLGLQSLACAAIGWRTWPPTLRFRRSDLADYLGFGGYQMAQRIANHLASYVDYLIVGLFLGPTALGVYSLAYQLVVRPLVYLNPIIVNVAFPIFAQKQDDNDALGRGYVHVVQILGYIVFPLLVGLGVFAPVIVPLVLGAKWSAAIPVLQILAGVGAVRSIYNPAGPVVLAKGRPELILWLNVRFLGIMTLALIGASQAGLQAVAWTVLIVVTAQGAMWWVTLKRLIGLPLGASWAAIRGALSMALAAGAASWALGQALAELAAPRSVQFAAMLVAGAGVYGLLVMTLDRAYVGAILGLLKKSARDAGA